uniref:Uncharacterized protein n=1 Tax=Panagrolaimus superbus TaxID=310955 RepID=A0A914YLY5_9BILA
MGSNDFVELDQLEDLFKMMKHITPPGARVFIKSNVAVYRSLINTLLDRYSFVQQLQFKQHHYIIPEEEAIIFERF